SGACRSGSLTRAPSPTESTDARGSVCPVPFEVSMPSLTLSASDAGMLAAYQESRSGDAFAALVARHAPWVLRLCHRRLGPYQDAEDVCQAVFLALARQPERVQQSLTGWLHCAALRAGKDWRRGPAAPTRRGGAPAL